MGYRYHYTLPVSNITIGDVDTISNILDEESTYNTEVFINEGSALFMLSDVSWDDPSDALKRISEQFPGKLFEMWYEGDSWDDRGTVYAKDGRTQTCVLIPTYEDVDDFFKE